MLDKEVEIEDQVRMIAGTLEHPDLVADQRAWDYLVGFQGIQAGIDPGPCGTRTVVLVTMKHVEYLAHHVLDAVLRPRRIEAVAVRVRQLVGMLSQKDGQCALGRTLALKWTELRTLASVEKPLTIGTIDAPAAIPGLIAFVTLA